MTAAESVQIRFWTGDTVIDGFCGAA